MDLPELSPEELRFCEEYAKDKNGVRAALVAGLAGTYFGANTAARRLLQKDSIRACLKHIAGQYAKRLKLDVPDILREWAAVSKADVTDYAVTEAGRLTVEPGVPKAQLRAVKKFKHYRTERLSRDGNTLTVEQRTEIELHDKLSALSKLYDHLTGGEGDKAGAEAVVRLLRTLLADRLPAAGGPGPAGGGGGPPADPRQAVE